VKPSSDIPGFRTSLIVEKVAARRWRLVSDLCYRSDVVRTPPLVVLVPEGATTDFASVPRGLWNLFPPDNSYTAAAVVHDYLYVSGKVSRAVADAVFLEAMEVCGTRWLERHIIWLSVRLFGWLHYQRPA
jgi:hypothetical protein